MRQFRKDIVPPASTHEMWGYNGLVPGPTIRAAEGQAGRRPADQQPARHAPDAAATPCDLDAPARRRRRCRSTTATPTTSPQPGQYKDYLYPNDQARRGRSGTTTTPSHHTAENIYMGLAAQYHLTDDEAALPLPKGALRRRRSILRTRSFDADGQLLFNDNGQSRP